MHIALQGRNGKGSIYVWANGNGGEYDDCAADGYTQSIYSISVGAIGVDGNPSPFDEECSAKLVSTYVTNPSGYSAVVNVLCVSMTTSICLSAKLLCYNSICCGKFISALCLHYIIMSLTDYYSTGWRMHHIFWWNKCCNSHGVRNLSLSPRSKVSINYDWTRLESSDKTFRYIHMRPKCLVRCISRSVVQKWYIFDNLSHSQLHDCVTKFCHINISYMGSLSFRECCLPGMYITCTAYIITIMCIEDERRV